MEYHLEKKYFMEIHDCIRNILKEKTHLIEESDIPSSFYDYLKHSIMQKIQIELWENEKVSTENAKGFPLTDKFERDIRSGLLNALNQREKLMRSINHDSN